MAVLTPSELAELRRGLAKNVMEIVWKKAAANRAYQAIEDLFESRRDNFDSAIGPRFSEPQKRKMIALWMHQKFRREEVL